MTTTPTASSVVVTQFDITEGTLTLVNHDGTLAWDITNQLGTTRRVDADEAAAAVDTDADVAAVLDIAGMLHAATNGRSPAGLPIDGWETPDQLTAFAPRTDGEPLVAWCDACDGVHETDTHTPAGLIDCDGCDAAATTLSDDGTLHLCDGCSTC